jgi:hypothetical protein
MPTRCESWKLRAASGRSKFSKICACVPAGTSAARTQRRSGSFNQCVRRERRLVDYHESSGEHIVKYADVLYEKKQEHGWTYGEHFWPHDMAYHMLDAEKSRIEQMREAG